MIAHQLKRVTQTPRAFSNWPGLLRDMANGRTGRGPDTLTFETRSGQRISCPNRPGARVPVYEVFAEDCYRLEWFLGPLASRPIMVLDIGAHVGAFACQLAALNPQATLECFEPSNSTADFLRLNIDQNGFASRITVDQRAVAAHEGWANFADNGAGSALNGLIPDRPGVAATSIETTTFDAVVGSTSAPIDVVKLDCEGGEYDAVLGSSPASWSSVQRVVLEYHPSSEHVWAELRSWFAEQGLDVIREEAASDAQGTAWLTRRSASDIRV